MLSSMSCLLGWDGGHSALLTYLLSSTRGMEGVAPARYYKKSFYAGQTVLSHNGNIVQCGTRRGEKLHYWGSLLLQDGIYGGSAVT